MSSILSSLIPMLALMALAFAIVSWLGLGMFMVLAAVWLFAFALSAVASVFK